MITLISTPAYPEPADPTIISRWLATESPSNFRMLRTDYALIGSSNVGGYFAFNPSPAYAGAISNSITVIDDLGNTYNGLITDTSTSNAIKTDILYSSIVGTAIILNDNTDYAGYYFEGRLIVNGVTYPLTIVASPNSQGLADLDVSGILKIITSIGKVGDYTSRIQKEYTKSGKFNFEFRECWYGHEGSWEGDIITSPPTSPPSMNDWFYGEAVRSEEQGSNLHEFVPNTLNDAPFLNQFDQPVYFLGLPFDLSFILPEIALTSPLSDITVTLRIYDSNNLLLTTVTELVDVDSLEGFICSLNIDQASIPTNAAYLTAEISV